MYPIDITAKIKIYDVFIMPIFFCYVLRNRMPFICNEYVAQCSFVWTVSRLCRYTVGYFIGMFETQVVYFGRGCSRSVDFLCAGFRGVCMCTSLVYCVLLLFLISPNCDTQFDR